MTHQVIGYVRVSSQGQNTARQLQGIELDMEFIDKVTGSNLDREKLKECVAYARKGDTVVIDSIDRLARNLRDLQEILETFTKKGVIVKFLKENLTFTDNDDAISRLMLQMIGAFAEFERTMIRSRQREGIDSAKKAGKHLGRPHKIDNNMRKIVKEKIQSCQSIRSIAKEINVSRATIYKVIEQLNQSQLIESA
jgi:DNA invertase Pin-like site-specific DNA recombinase